MPSKNSATRASAEVEPGSAQRKLACARELRAAAGESREELA